jgi:hypothetical protein
MLPIELHDQVSRAREAAGKTTSEYITQLLIEYYKMKKDGGTATMATRTMAFQIPEGLFQRIKAHLDRETDRTGRKLTQRDFVLGLIEAALNEAERQAGVGPCEAPGTGAAPRGHRCRRVGHGTGGVRGSISHGNRKHDRRNHRLC